MMTPLKHLENQKILFLYRVYKTNNIYLKTNKIDKTLVSLIKKQEVGNK